MVAPFAGALAALAAATLWGLIFVRDELIAAVIAAAVMSLFALAICVVYTLAIGLGVVVYLHGGRKTPSRGTALGVGLLTGFLPFVAYAVNLAPAGSAAEVLLFPLLALAASLATAWTFWALGLKGRSSS